MDGCKQPHSPSCLLQVSIQMTQISRRGEPTPRTDGGQIKRYNSHTLSMHILLLRFKTVKERGNLFNLSQWHGLKCMYVCMTGCHI